MKTQFKLSDIWVEKPNHCFIIAEAGSNHNGDLELGKNIIDAAKRCGCDAVKFQAFKTENLVTKIAGKADYQKGRSPGNKQFEMLKDLELSAKDHCALIEHAKTVGIPLFYSVFDEESADIIDRMGIDIFKLGSGELTNTPLIKHISRKNKPLIISTGMATDEEVADAIDAARGEGNKQLLLMNCSTGYPSRLEDTNLRRVFYLEKKFGLPCGQSDHSEGILVGIIFAAFGGFFIEKHFTLDRSLPGPDHFMSADPLEMRELCNKIRIIEEKNMKKNNPCDMLRELGIDISKRKIYMILGKQRRKLSQAEKDQRIWARKSLVASRDIKQGEILTKNNLSIKRPEEGVLPKDYDKVIGRRILCAVKEGTPIQWEMLG